MARLSAETRHEVVVLHQQGLSQSKISKQTGVSRCAIQALLKKHKETGNIEDRKRSGRPRKLSAADEIHIILASLRDQKVSSSAISSELAETSGTQVHPSTIRRRLARSHLHERIAANRMSGCAASSELTVTNASVHTSTVQRSLASSGLHGKIASKKMSSRATNSEQAESSEARESPSTLQGSAPQKTYLQHKIKAKCASVPRKIEAVLKAKGCHSK